MISSNIPPNAASAITPFNPLGKSTVGEEQKDNKNTTIKAVEKSAESSESLLRNENNNAAVELEQQEPEQDGSGSSSNNDSQFSEKTQHQQDELISSEPLVSDNSHLSSQPFLPNSPNALKQSAIGASLNKNDVDQQYGQKSQQSDRLGGIVSEAV